MFGRLSSLPTTLAIGLIGLEALPPPTTSAVAPCPTQSHSQLFRPSTPFLASAAMSASSGALLPSAPALLSEPPTTSAASNEDQSQSPILSKSQRNKLRKRAKAAQAAATEAEAAAKSTGGRDYDWHHTHMAKLFERTADYAAHQKKGSKGNAENFAINTQLTELLGIATGYDCVLLGKNIPHPTNPLKMVLNDRVPVPFRPLASIRDEAERAFVAQERQKFRDEIHKVSDARLPHR
jgi:hypothetical protein